MRALIMEFYNSKLGGRSDRGSAGTPAPLLSGGDAHAWGAGGALPVKSRRCQLSSYCCPKDYYLAYKLLAILQASCQMFRRSSPSIRSSRSS